MVLTLTPAPTRHGGLTDVQDYLPVMTESIQDPTTKVLFNGDCPVCSREINHYAKYSEKNALAIRYDDLNTKDLTEWGLTQDQAARRLYVAQGDQLLSGMPAFRVLWAEMPRYRWLARIAGWPIVRPLTVFTYDRILAPAIYRWHISRQRRQSK